MKQIDCEKVKNLKIMKNKWKVMIEKNDSYPNETLINKLPG